MKRRIFLLTGAVAMSVTSALGVTIANPAPASANGFATIGYLIQCLTPPTVFNNLAVCLREALEDLLGGLGLPAFGSPFATGAGVNAPRLTLPSNISDSLKSLPPALQTTPVAAAAPVSAPVTPLIPSLPNLNLGSRAAAVPSGGVTNPIATPIKMFNIAASTEESSSPVSGADAAGLAGLGLLGAAAVFGAKRRRAAIS